MTLTRLALASAAAGTLLSLLATAPGGAATPSPAPSAAATVHIKDFAYKSPVVTVTAGQAILFVNDDDEAHTVTSNDKLFESGGLDQGDSWVHVFDKTGTYHYFCALHPWMKGTIVVKAAKGTS